MIKQTLLGTVLFFSSTFAQADSVDVTQVLATVGDKEITLGQLISMRAQLPAQYEQLPADAIYKGLLDQAIDQELLASAIRQDPKYVTYALENEKRNLLSSVYARQLTQDAVSEEALGELYQETYVNAGSKTEFNAAHLLVKTEEEANLAKARVEKGEAFSDVVRDVSTGPTGPNGGSLGWFGEGQMVAPFEAAVKGLKVGELSEAVQTQFGWHIIQLNDRRDKDVPPLDDVRAELSAQLEGQALQAKLKEIASQTEVERVDVSTQNLEALSNYDLIGWSK